jgi:dCTP deaminase
VIEKSDLIAERLRAGLDPGNDDPLVITPTPNLEELEQSGSASVDLRLGTWFMTLRQARMTHLSPDDKMPKAHPQLTKTHYVRFGNRYTLHPGNFVLSSTLEWIRLPKDLAAYVIGRSSWGRRGLIIATATGVHPSFTGCLTLELTNVGELPICIYPGMTICQLFFHTVKAGKANATDHSQFVCSRKPSVGKIRLQDDDFAWKLANAYKHDDDEEDEG